ncbi:MAG: thioredoxin-dependent thiol peroxidase [Patescibacteria group bacterium]
MPKVGETAPDFTLQDQDGAQHTLSSYRGKPVLIYFYPKDDTPGCTKQACAIRDAEPDFQKLKAVVLGISADSIKSHKKFVEKYGLTFPLLADEDKKVVNAYGVWGRKKFMGREYDGIFRTSFLVGADGTILKLYEGVKAEKHAEEVLSDLRELA